MRSSSRKLLKKSFAADIMLVIKGFLEPKKIKLSTSYLIKKYLQMLVFLMAFSLLIIVYQQLHFSSHRVNL
jgi:hypothetical protein